jgi:hypothetical protein
MIKPNLNRHWNLMPILAATSLRQVHAGLRPDYRSPRRINPSVFRSTLNGLAVHCTPGSAMPSCSHSIAENLGAGSR